MKILGDITSEIKKILKDQWSVRHGEKVPEISEIKLGNEEVSINATVLYADLKEFTKMVNTLSRQFAVEVYKSYLLACCEIIKNNAGVITAFDGDRVMAVYIGDCKNTNAVRTALQINYVLLQVINPAIKDMYDTKFQIRQVVGIDTSELFVARTGIRGDNDLVWVGNVANMAAKMCAIRDGNISTFISKDVFESINDSAKYSNEVCMWKTYHWPEYSKIFIVHHIIGNLNSLIYGKTSRALRDSPRREGMEQRSAPEGERVLFSNVFNWKQNSVAKRSFPFLTSQEKDDNMNVIKDNYGPKRQD